MPAPGLTRIRVAVLAVAARMVFALPGRVLALIFGPPPDVARGLRPDAWALCRIAALIEKDASGITVGEMRQDTEELARVVTREPDSGVSSKDFDLGVTGHPLPARLYVPADAPAGGPLMVYFHGGGWVVGSLDTHDRACRRLAKAGGTRILAVDYRLAPEHPFPAAPDDALTAWQAVQADPGRFGADPSRIGVGGDSAGGNLAAVLCQDLRDMGQPQPLFQLLIYPVVKIGAKTRSKVDFARNFYLTTERMDWYDEQYSPGDLGLDHRASPALNEDLSGLAPTYIVSALADPLRDEAEEYASDLGKAGVPVRLDRMPLVHAWFNVTLSRSSLAAHEVIAGQIRRYMAEVPDPAPSISAD
jgi:acetyl esterase